MVLGCETAEAGRGPPRLLVPELAVVVLWRETAEGMQAKGRVGGQSTAVVMALRFGTTEVVRYIEDCGRGVVAAMMVLWY